MRNDLLGVPTRKQQDYAALIKPTGNGSGGTSIVTYAQHEVYGSMRVVHDAINGDYIIIPETGVYSVFRQLESSANGNIVGVSINTT